MDTIHKYFTKKVAIATKRFSGTIAIAELSCYADIAVFNRMRYQPIDALGPRPNPQAYLIEQRRAINSVKHLLQFWALNSYLYCDYRATSDLF
ncbi:MAG: hypothetical protein WBL95_17035 [Microcoleus sp.]